MPGKGDSFTIVSLLNGKLVMVKILFLVPVKTFRHTRTLVSHYMHRMFGYG